MSSRGLSAPVKGQAMKGDSGERVAGAARLIRAIPLVVQAPLLAVCLMRHHITCVSMASADAAAAQEVPVPLSVIQEVWRRRKISHSVARRDAQACRHPGAQRFCDFVSWVEEQEAAASALEASTAAQEEFLATRCRWRDHELLAEWQLQFLGAASASTTRFKALLLRGESRSGKTRRAVALLGPPGSAFVVNCQNASGALPSIVAFKRHQHRGIVWDEVTERQVLDNKLVFQSGIEQVTLGQSACNAFAYSRFLWAVPQILCSNTFAMTREQNPALTDEDLDWLQQNILPVELPPGEKWYLEEEIAASMEAGSAV